MSSFGYVILYVTDVEASISFYERAFCQTRNFIAPGGDYGELRGTPVPISFARRDLATASTGLSVGAVPPAGATLPFEIAFVANDVAEALRVAVEAGAVLVKPVTQKPWGQSVAYVKDINGFLVELCTKVCPK
jgi:lactoylglutathione lyase